MSLLETEHCLTACTEKRRWRKELLHVFLLLYLLFSIIICLKKELLGLLWTCTSDFMIFLACSQLVLTSYEDTNVHLYFRLAQKCSFFAFVSAIVYAKLHLLILKILKTIGGECKDNSSREWQDKPQAGRKHLQKTYMIKDCN